MNLVLPYPPTVNTIWRHVLVPIGKACPHCGRPHSSVRVLLSKEGRRYRTDAQAAILAAVGKPEAIVGRCQAHLVVYPPDRRARDLGNLEKAVSDSLQFAGVFANDSLIDYLTIRRAVVSESPRVEVSVEPLLDAQGLLFAPSRWPDGHIVNRPSHLEESS